MIEKMIAETEQKTSEEITTKLMQNSIQVTSKSREFMEANPNEAEPKGYDRFPGKMDHTTCITIKVKSLEIVHSPNRTERRLSTGRLQHRKRPHTGFFGIKKSLTITRSPKKRKT